MSSVTGSMKIAVNVGMVIDAFDKELVAAKKKAGRSVGKKITDAHVRDVQRAFGSISKSHRKKIHAWIHKENGGLVVADLSRSANLRESGGVVKGSPWLTIWFEKSAQRPSQTKEKTFIRRSRKGKLLIFAKRDGRWIPVGVLKRQLIIPKQYHLHEHVEKYTGEYCDEVERNLIEGFNDAAAKRAAK